MERPAEAAKFLAGIKQLLTLGIPGEHAVSG